MRPPSILAILTVLALIFIGAATIWKPEAVFDPGMHQDFWTVNVGGLLSGLTRRSAARSATAMGTVTGKSTRDILEVLVGVAAILSPAISDPAAVSFHRSTERVLLP